MTRSNLGRDWRWSQFKGSAECIALNKRDLQHLELALSYTPKRGVAVQAGGNLGIFPKALAGQFQAVYSFEADPNLFRIAIHNAPEPNIVWFNAALGFERKMVRMVNERLVKKNKPPHEGVTHVGGPGIIPTMRVDDLDLPVIDLLYLDIEGQEFAALKGAEMSILLRRPVIVVEINQTCEAYGILPDTVRASIIGMGYRKAETIRSDEIFVPQE